MSRTSVYKRIAVGAEFPSDSVYKQLGNLKILFIGGEKVIIFKIIKITVYYLLHLV